LHCIALSCAALSRTALQSAALRLTALYSAVLRCTALYCAALCCPALRCARQSLKKVWLKSVAANLSAKKPASLGFQANFERLSAAQASAAKFSRLT
jgi:hypothetical protein